MPANVTTPYTEQSNPLSEGLSDASPEQLANILGACEAQVFSGYDGQGGLGATPTLTTVCKVVGLVQDAVRSDGLVVMSGCGTSGRMAFFAARTFNKILTSACLRYLVSGGDTALLMSDELPEDDPITGASELEAAIQDCKGKVVFIGITCGISAPYVAGQLDYALKSERFSGVVLLGFNPLHLARDLPIELWEGRSMRDVVQAMEQQAKHDQSKEILFLNPLIGPEPLTGSSRMKGGSATKILLETIFALTYMHLETEEKVTEHLVMKTFNRYQAVHFHTCRYTDVLGPVIEAAGTALKNQGRILYLGEGALGVVAFIDASEMPDTFGTPHSEVRAFLEQGWSAMGNALGDLTDTKIDDHGSGFPGMFSISLAEFRSNVLNTVTSNDVVIALGAGALSSSSPVGATLLSIKERNVSPHVYAVEIVNDADAAKESDLHVDKVRIVLPESLSLLSTHNDLSLASQSAKYVLNMISTGANVANGMTEKNFMVNMTVANNKLFHRAANMVQQFGCVSQEAAVLCLLKSIYGDVLPTPEARAKMELSTHIALAVTKTNVIPRAIKLAKTVPK